MYDSGKTERAIQLALSLIRQGKKVAVLSEAEAESLRKRASAEGLDPAMVLYLSPPDPKWAIDEIADLDLGVFHGPRSYSHKRVEPED